MLKQRVITAVILVAVFLAALFLAPPFVFQGLVLIMVAIAAWEWGNLSGLKNVLLRSAYAASLVMAMGVCWLLLNSSGALQSFFVVAVIWWTIALLWVQGYPSSALFWQNSWARMLMGALVLVPAGVAIFIIHSLPQGKGLVLSLLLLVAAADTGAYFSGKAFGRRKLAPQVSPGKSWEGVIGGLCLVVVIAVIYGALFADQWFEGLVIALPAAAASVLGDLVESMVKRHRGVKDSGHILPGHGGVLDRIDGITAAAPVFALGLLASGWAF